MTQIPKSQTVCKFSSMKQKAKTAQIIPPSITLSGSEIWTSRQCDEGQ